MHVNRSGDHGLIDATLAFQGLESMDLCGRKQMARNKRKLPLVCADIDHRARAERSQCLYVLDRWHHAARERRPEGGPRHSRQIFQETVDFMLPFENQKTRQVQ